MQVAGKWQSWLGAKYRNKMRERFDKMIEMRHYRVSYGGGAATRLPRDTDNLAHGQSLL